MGKAVDQFEAVFKNNPGSNYALGVGSGTDAIFLSLKALGVGEGDEVITTPYTFFATVGAIVTSGARPVFVDISDDYNIDVKNIEAAVTPKTKVILPVHWSGLVCDMAAIQDIANKRKVRVIEDACHAIQARRGGRLAGSFGSAGCFSMHPLKNLNVWGDGGVVVTDDEEIYEKIALLRNHGLMNRDVSQVFSYNSRLDTIQALVGLNMMGKRLENITNCRIKNASMYDEMLSGTPELAIPERLSDAKHVYHLYIVRAQRRDELKEYLISNGIDAKVHYPIPMHLQPAAREYGYKEGDFPVCEETCRSIISLPVHEFITEENIKYVSKKVKEFYATN